MKIYGLKTCDTCRKAMKSLGESGTNPEFFDVRQSPLSRDHLERLLAKFGDQLVNTRSTTWRNLTATEKSNDHLNMLIGHPALMKRPVIDDGVELTLGWNATILNFWLGR